MEKYPDRKPLILQGASQDINYDDIFSNNPLLNNFKEGLTENYVFNQLIENGLNPYYWTSKSDAVVDFIIKFDNNIIPVAVKSSINNRSKSLNVYIERYKPTFSLRISQRNFGFENNIRSIPLYAIFCIKKQK